MRAAQVVVRRARAGRGVLVSSSPTWRRCSRPPTHAAAAPTSGPRTRPRVLNRSSAAAQLEDQVPYWLSGG